jgi:hypothetical protein
MVAVEAEDVYPGLKIWLTSLKANQATSKLTQYLASSNQVAEDRP